MARVRPAEAPRTGRTARLAVWPAVALALLVWGGAWARVADPNCYLDEGHWRAASWLRTSPMPGAVAVAEGEPEVLLGALSGRALVPAGEEARLRLAADDGCDAPGARFWYLDVCLIEQ